MKVEVVTSVIILGIVVLDSFVEIVAQVLTFGSF